MPNATLRRKAGLDEGQEITAAEAKARNAGGMRRRNVALLVADQETRGFVEIEIGERAQDHAGSRFAVDVALAELFDASLRMIGTIVEGIDDGALRGELIAHPRVQGEHAVLAIVSVGDAGLVGHHHHAVAKGVEAADAGDRTWHPFDLLGPVHVAVIDVEHPVTVEKHRGPWVCHQQKRSAPSGRRHARAVT